MMTNGSETRIDPHRVNTGCLEFLLNQNKNNLNSKRSKKLKIMKFKLELIETSPGIQQIMKDWSQITEKYLTQIRIL